MKFKGTIVITDPCYIIRKKDMLTKDDWDACDYGDNMQALGITHYITERTIYGDWSCTTYKTEKPKEAVDGLAKIFLYYNKKCTEYGGFLLMTPEQEDKLCLECDKMQDELNLSTEKLGNFCADTGLVSVFLLDEVLAYNPDFGKWIEEHPWCVTTIKDFNGDVEYYVDEADNAHIIGIGSTNFFTFY